MLDTHDEGLDVVEEETNLVLLSTAKSAKTNLLLDTQATIHIICEESLIENLHQSDHIITVQGITRDITEINHLGHLKTIGIQVYYSPKVAANTLSYSKLQDTHVCTVTDESFRAVP